MKKLINIILSFGAIALSFWGIVLLNYEFTLLATLIFFTPYIIVTLWATNIFEKIETRYFLASIFLAHTLTELSIPLVVFIDFMVSKKTKAKIIVDKQLIASFIICIIIFIVVSYCAKKGVACKEVSIVATVLLIIPTFKFFVQVFLMSSALSIGFGDKIDSIYLPIVLLAAGQLLHYFTMILMALNSEN